MAVVDVATFRARVQISREPSAPQASSSDTVPKRKFFGAVPCSQGTPFYGAVEGSPSDPTVQKRVQYCSAGGR